MAEQIKEHQQIPQHDQGRRQLPEAADARDTERVPRPEQPRSADDQDTAVSMTAADAAEASADTRSRLRHEVSAPGPVAAAVLRRIAELYAGCGVQMRVGLTLLRDYLNAHAQCEVLDSQHLEDVVRELRPDVKSSTIYATRLRQACRAADMPLINDERPLRTGGDENAAQADAGTAVPATDADLEDLIVEYFKRRIRIQCQSIDLRRLYRRAELEVLEEIDLRLDGKA